MFGIKSKKTRFQGKTISTIDEYLEIEEQVAETYEFWDGWIKSLNRPEDLMERVCNSVKALSKELVNKKYKVFSNSPKKIKVWIESENCLFYPDLFVVENEIHHYSGREDIIANPLMIIEVSEADSMAIHRNGEYGDQTYLTDRTTKFWKYQQIPSLKEYVIISDSGAKIVIETYNRLDDEHWKYQVFSKTGNKVVELETIGIKLPGNIFYF